MSREEGNSRIYRGMDEGGCSLAEEDAASVARPSV